MYKKAVKELKECYNIFCLRTPIHGMQYMVRTDITYTERLMWRLLVVTLVSIMCYLCFQIGSRFYESPTVTSLSSTQYSVANIDLPGIAICSVNKISKRRAEEFIDELHTRFNVSKEWFKEQMTWFGKMHDFQIIGNDQRFQMQNMLDVIMEESDKWTDIRSILRRLSVSCDELLEACYWMGVKHDCKNLFKKRLTNDGFCCTFNYIKPTQRYSAKEWDETVDFLKTYDMSMLNYQNALKILINNMPDDYFYADLLYQGVIVKIFERYVYPDSSTSGVHDVIVGLGYQAYLTLDAHHIRASEELKKYPLTSRQCIMDIDNLPHYLSECLLICKIRTVKALCNCIPFMYPFDEGFPVCNLMDLPCLNKYKDKLNTIYPYSMETDELDKEKEDSLHCICYPSCTKTPYNVNANYAHLHKERFENYSYINIFYGKKYINLYEIDIILYWFELLGDIGGLASIVMGVSAVSLVEFLYYFIIFLFNMVFKKKFRPDV